jgi:hypothetical protein
MIFGDKAKDLDQFNEKNDILGMDRDLYLCIIQFLNTKTLRSYIGLSEETFERIKHNFYNVYRMKYDRIPIQKLLICSDHKEAKYDGRTLSNLFMCTQYTLKEKILDTIFELKMKYTGDWIVIQQRDATPHKNRPKNGSGIHVGACFDNSLIRICGIFWNMHPVYDVEEHLSPTLHMMSEQYLSKTETNEVIVILNMLKGKNMIHFKINGIMLPYVIYNIPHVQRQIRFQISSGGIATIVNTMHLKHPPIDLTIEYTYYNSVTGKPIN